MSDAAFDMGNGTALVVYQGPQTGSDRPLSEQEKLIWKLHAEVERLKAELAGVEEKEKLAVEIYDQYRTLKPYGNDRGAIDADSVLKAHRLMIEADNKRIAAETEQARLINELSRTWDTARQYGKLAEDSLRRALDAEKKLADFASANFGRQ